MKKITSKPSYKELEIELEIAKQINSSKLIFDLSKELFVQIDTKGIVRFVNKKALEVFAYSEQEMLGKNWFENFIPERISKEILPIAEKLLSGEIETAEYYENPILISNGEERLISWHNVAIRDKNENIIVHLSSGEDVTQIRAAEQELLETQSILEHSVAITFLWRNEEDWPVDFVSNNVETIFGYTAKDFTTGKVKYSKLIHSDDIARVSEEVAENIEINSKSFFHKPYRIICKQGNIKWVNDVTIFKRNSDGEITHFEGIIIDISKQVEVELENKKLSVAIEQSANTVVITDIDGNIEYTNPQFSELTGYTSEEAIGENPRILNAKTQNEEYYKEMWKTIASGQTWVGEFHNKTKQGVLYWEQVTITPIKDEYGKNINYLAVKENITDKKLAEEALISSEKQLRKTNAEKDKFFSIIAHDLKNPFNTMLGFTEILLNNYDTFESEKHKEFISIVHKQAKNTFKLLEDLLMWANSQRGNIEYHPDKENLYLLASNSIDILNQTALTKFINVKNEIPEDIFVKADRNMLCTIIRNILSNAIKFTPKNGEIIVQGKLISNDNNRQYAEISIEDNGVGISEEQQSKLFKITENVTTRGTENESGTGLGLILCKEFVERHSGEIRIESEVGTGSKFIFTIPIA